jgi:hypothetical protein
MAVPSKIDLPTDSPFFGKESEQQAVKRLSAIYLDKLKSGKPTGSAAKLDAALTAVVKNKSADRAPMGIGIAIFPDGGSPYFVGSHYDRLYSVHSIAKLALLYAAFQLRADLAVIGNTEGLAAESPYDYKSRVDDIIQGARKCVRKVERCPTEADRRDSGFPEARPDFQSGELPQGGSSEPALQHIAIRDQYE